MTSLFTSKLLNGLFDASYLISRSVWRTQIVIPILSTFSDIFDEVHFITTLQGDLRIVRELPKELESVPRARKHFTSWSGMGYYEEMRHLWKDYRVLHCFWFTLFNMNNLHFPFGMSLILYERFYNWACNACL